jgi:predicted transcriptional regulator
MNTLYRNYRSVTAAAVAIVIVGLTGLTLDQGHAGGLPRGVVEIGELETLSVGEIVIAALPEIQVIGSRDTQLADVEAVHADGMRG